jgi:tetratricopeptide (TPR) repeat protein
MFWGQVNLGHIYLETGRYEDDAESIRKALQIDAELKEGHLNLAMCEFFMGRPEEAVAILDHLIRKIPDYTPAWALHGAALILMGDDDRYKTTVDHLREKDINPAAFFQTYAEKLLAAGREEDGLRLLDAARSIWRDFLRVSGLEATDEEIERVMMLSMEDSPPSGHESYGNRIEFGHRGKAATEGHTVRYSTHDP